MYSTTDAYQTAIRQPVRGQESVSGVLTLRDGTVLTLTHADILSDSLTVDRQCVSGENLAFGCAYAAQTVFRIPTQIGDMMIDRQTVSGAAVSFSYKLQMTPMTSQSIPLGIFTVTKASQKEGVLTVTAMDAMIAFDRDYVMYMHGTPYHTLANACEVCGVSFGMTEAQITAMPNGNLNFNSSIFDKTHPTYRQVIGYVAQILGGFAEINRLGQLVIRSYQTEQTDMIPADCRMNHQLSNRKITYRGVQFDTQNGAVTATNNNNGRLLSVAGNPIIWYGEKASRQSIVNAAKTAIENVSYTPGELEWQGDPAIDCGDLIGVPTEHKNLFDTESAKIQTSSGFISDSYGKIENGVYTSKIGGYWKTVCLSMPDWVGFAAGHTYTVSCLAKADENDGNKTVSIGFIKENGQSITLFRQLTEYGVFEKTQFAFQVTESMKPLIVLQVYGSAQKYSDMNMQFKQIMVTDGTDTAFVPYVDPASLLVTSLTWRYHGLQQLKSSGTEQEETQSVTERETENLKKELATGAVSILSATNAANPIAITVPAYDVKLAEMTVDALVDTDALLCVSATVTTDQNGILSLSVKVGNTERIYHPAQNISGTKTTISACYPLSLVAGENTIGVYAKMSENSATCYTGDANMTLIGTGIE